MVLQPFPISVDLTSSYVLHISYHFMYACQICTTSGVLHNRGILESSRVFEINYCSTDFSFFSFQFPRVVKLIYLLSLVIAVINCGKMLDVLFAFLVTFPFCVQNGLFLERIRERLRPVPRELRVA